MKFSHTLKFKKTMSENSNEYITVKILTAANPSVEFTSGGSIDDTDPEGIVYTPAEGSAIRVSPCIIGKEFHWEQPLSLEFKGDVTVKTNPDGSKSVYNRCSMRDYIASVIGSEMNADSPAELLKAHAIISRTWAIRRMRSLDANGDEGKVHAPAMIIDWESDTPHADGSVICNDDHCQRYQGCGVANDATYTAAEETDGFVLTDRNGELIDTRYSKCCGGHTESFGIAWEPVIKPGLNGVRCDNCNPEDMEPMLHYRLLKTTMRSFDTDDADFYRWHTTISKADIADNLRKRFGRDLGEVLSVTPLEYGVSGRIVMLQVIGTDGSLILGKELMIRRLLSPTHLKSSAIEITDREDYLEIEGRGWGHGVGLCQIGAARMALEGATAEEILNYYYPGSKISKISR